MSIIDSGKQRQKNVGDTNYSSVTIKSYGTMSMGFVDQITA